MHFVTTLAMIGPVGAGIVADRIGTFSVVFIAYAVLLLAVLIAAVTMRKPKPPTGVGVVNAPFVATDLQSEGG